MNPCVRELGYTCILLLISSSWGLTMGYWSSAAVSFCDTFDITLGEDKRSRSSYMGTLFNLLAPGACVIGGPLINILLRKSGRKIATIVIAAFACVSWLALGVSSLIDSEKISDYFWVACVFRSMLGLSVGATSAVVPMYITELAPGPLRGAFGTLHQVGISIGASFCYALGCVKTGESTYLVWSDIAFYSAIPTGLCVCLLWIVPESPAVDRVEALSGITGNDSLCQKKFTRPFVISLLLMVFQQYGGTSAFLANLNNILDESKSGLEPRVGCLLVGVAGACASLVGSPMIGYFGRKVMWIVSSIGQTAALFLAAAQEQWKFSPILPVICLFADNLIFGLGTAPIPWFFVPELFPDSVRSTAAAGITAFSWVIGTLLFFIWDVMKDNIGQAGGFLVFGVIMAGSSIFGFFLPSNRDDGDLETIGDDYDSRVNSPLFQPEKH